MKVLKFGGSSVATPECIRAVVDIVEHEAAREPVVVVVSALGGVTETLLRAAEDAAARRRPYEETCVELQCRHQAVVSEVARPEDEDYLVQQLEGSCRELQELLHGVYLLRECTPRTLDSILSHGERLSAPIVAAALRARGLPAASVDARELVVTDGTFGQARVDVETTFPRIAAAVNGKDALSVLTGFIGATRHGETTTLGRGGSDYTAALVGAAMGATAVELWTDVDGVMSADPRLVSAAFPLRHLSYAELMELSHFGAWVVHPPSVLPARSHGIPLVIKSTFDPASPGTRVEAEVPPSPHPIRGLASINSVALLRLEGDGLVGEPAVAQRLFGALAAHRIGVILITQASSEHSICIAVRPEDTERAERVMRQEFALERRLGLVQEPVVEADVSVLAAVGEQMRDRPGIAGRIFSVLGEHGVNVRAIAQGSSELNISVVVDRRDEARALGAMHTAFFFPRYRRAEVAVAGSGRVATALVDQITRAAPGLAERHDLDLRVVALWNRRTMAVEPEGVDLARWRQALEAGSEPELGRIARLLEEGRGAVRVLVDCTACDDMDPLYHQALAMGASVVAANKRPFAGPFRLYTSLMEEAAAAQASLRFETTVGAGLPVLATLEDLVRTGDEVHRIDGILSGTLNFVLDRLDQGESFSQAVGRAHAGGLTEPHPADDLSGGDVARKLCILARVAGLAVEPEEVEVEPLLPPGDWLELELAELWRRLEELDASFARRQKAAAKKGQRLRYVASLEGGKARVALTAVPAEHPCFGVTGPDNLVAFTTCRYNTTPLAVRGPGAGPEVTAAGVFADLLRAVAEARV